MNLTGLRIYISVIALRRLGRHWGSTLPVEFSYAAQTIARDCMDGARRPGGLRRRNLESPGIFSMLRLQLGDHVKGAYLTAAMIVNLAKSI